MMPMVDGYATLEQKKNELVATYIAKVIFLKAKK
jgi:hypothetical protein